MSFNIGGSELLLILLIALLVFGPDKLPDFLRQAAKIWKRIMRFSAQMQGEFRKVARELELEEIAAGRPPGYDPATHSVPYQPPDIPHMRRTAPPEPSAIEPLPAAEESAPERAVTDAAATPAREEAA